MGVYIAAMEIPKTCGECEARHLAKCGVTLQWLLGPEDYYKTKKEDCPLVEIKTPHGRLIDADALFKAMGLDTVKEIMLQNWKCTTAWGVPIIEAEEK